MYDAARPRSQILAFTAAVLAVVAGIAWLVAAEYERRSLELNAAQAREQLRLHSLRQRLRAMIAATGFEGFRCGATALQSYDYVDELGRIAVPALLLAGEQDGAIPASMAANLLPAIAGARMETIAQAGHVPCLEQPDRFTAALDGFLRGL